MKTLLFLVKGFETMEFSAFVDVMGWARNDCHSDIAVVTCGFQRQVISTFHIPVLVDRTIDEVDVDEYEALAIPGGFEEYGFYEEGYDERLLALIRKFDEQGKVIAAVCVGALPIGKSGVLKGRRATTYDLGDGSRQKQLAQFGAKVENTPVVIDGNIITSNCPQTAPEVAFCLLEMLISRERAETVRRVMGF